MNQADASLDNFERCSALLATSCISAMARQVIQPADSLAQGCTIDPFGGEVIWAVDRGVPSWKVQGDLSFKF